MTIIKRRNRIPAMFDREEFLTPFDSLFDKIMKSNFPEFTRDFGVDFFGKGSYPKCDVKAHADKVEIEAAVPGMSKKDIKIEFHEKDRILTLSGEKQNEPEIGDQNTYITRELKKSSFKRSFRLGENLDGNSIKASFSNGMLTLGIPKVEPDEEDVVKEIKIK